MALRQGARPRLMKDMYLAQVKTPADSTGADNLLRVVRVVPGDQALRPISMSACPLVVTGTLFAVYLDRDMGQGRKARE